MRKLINIDSVKKIICCLVVSLLLVGCSSEKYQSWYLNDLNIDELWLYSQGEGQTIAIIDTGISDKLLKQYNNNIVGKYNAFDDTQNVKDIHGHGSEMVSLVLNQDKENNRLIGLAPKVKVIIIKAVNENGITDNKLILKSLEKATEMNATIVNLSLGGFKKDNQVVSQINEMVEKNITIVAASGDYGNKDILFPASVSGVISVGARDKNDELWEENNIDKNLICAFPGVDIPISNKLYDDLSESDKEEEDYTEKSGTSESTIIASSYIAILRSYYIKNNISFDNKSIIKNMKSLDSLKNREIDYLKLFKN